MARPWYARDPLGCCLCNDKAKRPKAMKNHQAFKVLHYVDGNLHMMDSHQKLRNLGPFTELKHEGYTHAPKPLMEVHYSCCRYLPAIPDSAPQQEPPPPVQDAVADSSVEVRLAAPPAAASPMTTRCRQAEQHLLKQQQGQLQQQYQQLQDQEQQLHQQDQQIQQLQQQVTQQKQQLEQKEQQLVQQGLQLALLHRMCTCIQDSSGAQQQVAVGPRKRQAAAHHVAGPGSDSSDC